MLSRCRLSSRLAPFCALVLLAGALPAQATVTATTRMATRAELQRLQGTYDQLAASTAYSERTRAKARAQADEVRRRLRDGDFRVGDRIVLAIGGGVTVNDTVTVLEGPSIQVQSVRAIDLAGVLRAELATKVATEVREIVKEATVSVQPLTRIAVFGAVTTPGFYSVPAETTIDQLITLAGGPTDAARPERVRLLRGETVLLRGRDMLAAISQGRTLDGLDTREGDILELERADQGWQMQHTVQLATMLVGPLITFLLLR